ncbi:MAG: hypothetical protein LBL48_00375 [Azoarcus sp.]|jgi:hypothetical protein|nr:hypothetical protein [Azoarcus sp.]
MKYKLLAASFTRTALSALGGIVIGMAAMSAAHAVTTPATFPAYSPYPVPPAYVPPAPPLLAGGKYRVEFRGLGDRLFLAADLNTAHQVATIQTWSGQPHSYFRNEYASIKIENSAGIAYPGCYKPLFGNVYYSASTMACPLRVGDFVSITHQEPYGGYASPLTGTTSMQRLQVFDAFSGLPLPKTTTVRYRVAPGGALVLFSATDAYIGSALYPVPLAAGMAKTYRVEFRGLGNTVFSVAHLDMTNKLVSIQTASIEPHVYFRYEYASITIENPARGWVCHQSFVGNQHYDAGVQNCPFLPGDIVTVKHLEPYESIGRLHVYDPRLGFMLPKGHVARYQAGFDGSLRAISIIP